MTGFPRSLFASFPDEVVHDSIKPTRGVPNPPTGRWWEDTSWAGPLIPKYPHLVVAASIKNHVLDIIGKHGGYDLFVYEPGTVHALTWEVLAPDPNSVNKRGQPNRMFVHLGGEEGTIPYDKNASRWETMYASNVGSVEIRHLRIQQFLWQLKSLHICHEWVLARAKAENIKYKYIVRMRPDEAWKQPIPPPHTLDHLFAYRFIFYQPGTYPSRPRDSFAMGRSDHMAAYMSRFQDVFTKPKQLDKPRPRWDSEYCCLRSDSPRH